jgi:hypothetical protein
MVLAIMPGGAARAGRTPTLSGLVVTRGEAGSQALEFAMVLPLLGLLLALLAQTGLLLADVVVVQGIAREAGRAAAIDDAAAAREVAERLAGDRGVRVDVADRGGLVEARVELATGAFSGMGVDLWLPARAVFRRETWGGAVDAG